MLDIKSLEVNVHRLDARETFYVAEIAQAAGDIEKIKTLERFLENVRVSRIAVLGHINGAKLEHQVAQSCIR